MKAAAKAAGTSQIQCGAALIRAWSSLERPSSLSALAGAWADDFPALEEIRRGSEDEPGREPL
jgi:hypothetical protein